MIRFTQLAFEWYKCFMLQHGGHLNELRVLHIAINHFQRESKKNFQVLFPNLELWLLQ